MNRPQTPVKRISTSDRVVDSRVDAVLGSAWFIPLRMAWVCLAVLAVAFFIATLPVRWSQLNNPPEDARINLAQFGLPVSVYATLAILLGAVVALSFLATATVIFIRKPDEWMALFVAFMLVGMGASANAVVTAEMSPIWRFAGDMLGYIGWTAIFVFFFVFPDGRFIPRWTRVVAAAFVAQQVFHIAFPETVLDSDTWPAAVSGPFFLGIFGMGIVAQIYRYRRISDVTERQQTKWVVFGVVMAAAMAVLINEVVPQFLQTEPGAVVLREPLVFLFVLLIPLSIGVGILRYRLWDIDTIINRTLVYGALTVCVVGLYVLIVGYLGTLFWTGDNLFISLLATGIVAVAFQPLRERLQSGVNRLLYGERDEPYAVLARLGQHLERTLVPQAMLPAIVETVAQALKLPYVAIALKQDETFAVAAAHGVERPAHVLTLPLTYHSEMVGQLSVAPRSAGEPFSQADQRILNTIAQQVGVVAHAVSLTADLQRSRERLVTAREEERRRLRRDLHDGLGPALASLTLKLDATGNLIPDDPDAAQTLIAELKQQTKTAIADIRRVVYDLRPPALDELGLVSALREQAAQYSSDKLWITVDAPDVLPALPAAVEVAAYRIALEALMNVVRHSGAHRCSIQLWIQGSLQIEVADDGHGLGDTFRAGVGLASMRERAAELSGSCEIADISGGGTRVLARLPLTNGEQ